MAASRSGCVVYLQPYADLFLDRYPPVYEVIVDDRLFSTLFGFVGIGTCTILAIGMLAKARTTEARYIRIAEKGGI